MTTEDENIEFGSSHLMLNDGVIIYQGISWLAEKNRRVNVREK